MGWFLLAAGLGGLDLWIKHWIQNNRELHSVHPMAGGHIIITKFFNDGAFLGFMRKRAKVLLGVTLVGIGIMAGLLLAATGKKGNILLKTGLALLIGGACSNGYERLAKGKVTDYFRIDIGSKRLSKIVFNLGDYFIFAGCLLTMIHEVINA